MKRTVIALGTAALMGVGTLTATMSPAAAAPNSYAYSAARWLEDQLTAGIVHNDQYDFDDYGLTLDIYFTLSDLDTRADTRSTILAAVEAHTDDYTNGWGFSPGAAGKLAVALIDAGDDPRDSDGSDLIASIEDTSDDTTGEISDELTYGFIGQSWATRALIEAQSAEADASLAFLLTKQCADGGFRQVFTGATCTSTLDATAFGLQTLLAARQAGTSGLDDEIARAADALVAAQAADGSLQNDGTANANTTGLAATVLAKAGRSGAAGSAASWLVAHQVTDAVAEDTALANETGAIAFDAAALAAGKTDGITTETRDQWIRATAQAAAGVQAQLPAVAVTVTKPAAFTAAGAKIAVKASGLTAGERYTAAISGGGTVSGVVAANGVVTATLTAPRGTATRTITVTGARSNRVGTASARVLAAKKLGLKVSAKSIKRKKTQKVTVRGLDAREPVRIYVRGKLVKKGVASAKGTYTYRFAVGSKRGKARVIVRGFTNDRKATASFTVKK